MTAKKKKAPKMKKCFRVEVTYPGSQYSDKTEATLRKVAGYSHASGMGFGVRDHAWYFTKSPAARKKAAKIRRIKSIKGLKVDVVPTECF